LHRAAVFHATGSQEARDIAKVVPDAPTVVIPFGIDNEAWQTAPAPDVLQARCGPAAGDRPIVLFLGRLHPVKGIIDLLLPAIATVTAPLHLALAGGPDARATGHNREIEQTVRRLGLVDRVTLLGEVSRTDRWHLFDGAAAFVLPSHSENFGMVVAEAMARGCPVVSTDTVNASEHVLAAGCGLVVPRDVGRLAAALTTVVTDPSPRTRFGAAGVRYARDRLVSIPHYRPTRSGNHPAETPRPDRVTELTSRICVSTFHMTP
jgi:glycosyltransferase involved in cell wall biosynthesis